jgi:hypothetical protein
MANPANFTITELSENGNIARPTAQTVDTDGMVPILAGSDLSRLLVEVTNSAAANVTVTIEAGDNPPALRAGLGALAQAGIAQNAVRIFGPFESARFGQDNGNLNVSFLAASSTPNCAVRVYRLPKM